jgi:RNA polymerase sigma-70 factor (ECF subfamily)
MNDKRRAIVAELPRLRRYARALMRDPDAADDLVQDCMERALLRLDNWQTGESPRRWLFTVMHHLFVDQMRKAGRRLEAHQTAARELDEPAAEPSQMEALATREVVDALQELAPERREAIVLVAVEGMSYAEAATLLGIPTGTLMSRIARGREDLRNALDRAKRRKTIRVVKE